MEPAANRKKSKRFDSPEQEAYLHMWRTYDRLKAIEEELFGRYELSAQQYNTLRLLRSVYPGSVPTLAIGAQLISRAPDMTRMVDKLEQRGLVARTRRSDNRRVVEVAVTEQGLALLEELDQPVRDCHAKQLGHLTAEDLQQLVRLMEIARRPHEDPEHPWLSPKQETAKNEAGKSGSLPPDGTKLP